MKKSFYPLVLIIFTLVISLSLTSRPLDMEPTVTASLADTILMMDGIWEDAYNNCKLDVMDEVISEDLEFYHDQGGLITSKQKLNEALKANICGKVKRQLKKGSLEVHP